MIREIDKKEFGNLLENCINPGEKKKIEDMIENNDFSKFWKLIDYSKNKKVIKWRENRLERIIKEQHKKWDDKHKKKGDELKK